MPDRSLFTLLSRNWRELSNETHNKVKAFREKKKLTKISGNKSSEINTLTKEGVSLKMYIVETNTSTQETEE